MGLGFFVLFMMGRGVLKKIEERRNDLHVQLAQTKQQKEDFIHRLFPKAKQLQQQYGILPSIILAQAILESDFGKSRLAKEYHNLFGVKAGTFEKKVSLQTQEYVDSKWITMSGEFKVYSSDEDSLLDHTLLLVNGTTWNAHQYDAVLQAKDYQQAAKALQDAGYATDPTYAQKIKNVIESYHLQQFDS